MKLKKLYEIDIHNSPRLTEVILFFNLHLYMNGTKIFLIKYTYVLKLKKNKQPRPLSDYCEYLTHINFFILHIFALMVTPNRQTQAEFNNVVFNCHCTSETIVH